MLACTRIAPSVLSGNCLNILHFHDLFSLLHASNRCLSKSSHGGRVPAPKKRRVLRCTACPALSPSSLAPKPLSLTSSPTINLNLHIYMSSCMTSLTLTQHKTPTTKRKQKTLIPAFTSLQIWRTTHQDTAPSQSLEYQCLNMVCPFKTG
jgi:hypothetical protein